MIGLVIHWTLIRVKSVFKLCHTSNLNYVNAVSDMEPQPLALSLLDVGYNTYVTYITRLKESYLHMKCNIFLSLTK